MKVEALVMEAKLAERDIVNAFAPERLLPPRMVRSCSNATASDIVCGGLGRAGWVCSEMGANCRALVYVGSTRVLSRRE